MNRRASPEGVCETSVPGGGWGSICKGPEAGACLVRQRQRQEAQPLWMTGQGGPQGSSSEQVGRRSERQPRQEGGTGQHRLLCGEQPAGRAGRGLECSQSPV